MARRGRARVVAAAAGGRKDPKKKASLSKEARSKLIKSLTSQLEFIVQQAKDFGKAVDDLDILALAKQYRCAP